MGSQSQTRLRDGTITERAPATPPPQLAGGRRHSLRPPHGCETRVHRLLSHPPGVRGPGVGLRSGRCRGVGGCFSWTWPRTQAQQACPTRVPTSCSVSRGLVPTWGSWGVRLEAGPGAQRGGPAQRHSCHGAAGGWLRWARRCQYHPPPEGEAAAGWCPEGPKERWGSSL